MTDIARLGLAVDSGGVVQARNSLNQFTDSAGRAERAAGGVSRATDVVAKAAGAMAVAFAALRAAEKIIEVQRAYDKLNASLITATGSVANANQAFGALQAFAANTPYGLNEVTQAFIKLRNMGLTPSERALSSYGNTASAMGKNLNMMVEAVADAATGEFERLKEFGIRASSQGDQVSLTFQGVTTTIGKSAKEIEGYLIKLGEQKFGGGMALQAKTLDGAISNLNDTFDSFVLKVSQGGIGEAAHGATLALTEALQDLGAIFDVVFQKATDEGKAIEETSLLHDGLRVTFETVAIVGMNVAFVFKQIGKDLGALAAQAAAFASAGSLSEGLRAIRTIGEARVAEAVEERRMLDANVEKVLWASEVRKQVAANERERKAREKEDALAGYAVETTGLKTVTEEQKKASKVLEDAYTKAANQIKERIMLEKLQIGATEELTEAEKFKAKMLNDLESGELKVTASKRVKLRALLDEYVAEERLVTVQERLKKQKQENIEFEDRATKIVTDSVDAVWEKARALQAEADNYGKTAVELIEYLIIQEKAKLFAVELTEIEVAGINQRIAALEALKDAQGSLATKEASKKAAEESAADWKRASDSIYNSITDALMRGFEGGKDIGQNLIDTLKNMFKSLVLQPVVRAVFSPLEQGLSGLFSGGGNGGGSSGGLSSLLQTGKGIYDMFSNSGAGFAASAGNMVSMAGNLFGSASTSAYGAGMGLSSLQAAEAAAAYNTAGMPGIASQLTAGSSMGGAVGAAGTAVAGIAGGVYGGRLVSGGYSAFGGSGNSAVNTGTAVGAAIGSIIPVIGTAIGALIGGLIGGAANRLFGHKPAEVTSAGITGTLASDNSFTGEDYSNWIKKGGLFRSDKTGTDRSPVDAETATGFSDTYASLKTVTSEFGKTIGVSAEALTTLASRSQALSISITKDQAANEKAVADFFLGVADMMATELVPELVALKKEGESASAALERLSGNYQAVELVISTLGRSSLEAFGAVGAASLAAREQLLEATGGVNALASGTAYFAQNFLPLADQMAPVIENVNAQLAALGYAGVKTTEDFATATMSLTEGGKLATKAGAETYAAMLQLAPQFKQVADYLDAIAKEQAEKEKAAAEKTAAEAKAAADKLAATNQVFLDELHEMDRALMTSAELRLDDIEGMHESTVALYDLVAARRAEEAATKASADALAKNIADFVATQYAGGSATKATISPLETQTAAMRAQAEAAKDATEALKAAEADAKAVAARAAAVATEGLGIQREMYQLTGDTAKLREMELAGIDPANRAAKQAYYDLQDKMAADQQRALVQQQIAQAQAQAAAEAARAQAQAAAEAARAQEEAARRAEEAAEALAEAWSNASDSAIDEVKRLRGEIDGNGTKTLVSAQAEFATATAQARAGDLEAYKLLPKLSQAVDALLESNAVTASDLRVGRARLASSLETTTSLRGLPSFDGGADMLPEDMTARVHKGEGILNKSENAAFRRFISRDPAAVDASLADAFRALAGSVDDLRTANTEENVAIVKRLMVVEEVVQKWDGAGLPTERSEA